MHFQTFETAKRISPLAAFFAALVVVAPIEPRAQETLFRCPGPAGGPAVTFDFQAGAGSDVILLEAENVEDGVPVVSVYLDAAVVPAFVHAYLPGECGTAQSGKRQCTTAITVADRRYRMLMMVFKLGREAHVTLESDGDMVLETSSPVGDFALDFDS
jgi:hypothetical protein